MKKERVQSSITRGTNSMALFFFRVFFFLSSWEAKSFDFDYRFFYLCVFCFSVLNSWLGDFHFLKASFYDNDDYFYSNGASFGFGAVFSPFLVRLFIPCFFSSFSYFVWHEEKKASVSSHTQSNTQINRFWTGTSTRAKRKSMATLLEIVAITLVWKDMVEE